MSSCSFSSVLRSFARGTCALPRAANHLCKTSRVACFVSGTIGMGASFAAGHALFHSPRAAALGLKIQDFATETAIPFLKNTALPFFTEHGSKLCSRVGTALYTNGALTATGGGVIASVTTLFVCGTCFLIYRRSIQKERAAANILLQERDLANQNLGEMTQARDGLQGQLNTATQTLGTRTQEHDALQTQFTAVESTLQTAVQEKDAATGKLTDLELALTITQGKLKTATRKLEQAQQGKNQAVKQRDAAKRTLENTKQELATARGFANAKDGYAATQTLASELSKMREQLEATEQQLAEKAQQLTNAVCQIEALKADEPEDYCANQTCSNGANCSEHADENQTQLKV